MGDEEQVRRTNRLAIEKRIFVEALRKLPQRPISDNKLLKELVKKFTLTLKDCEDEIPLDLTRFGLHGPMSYGRFLYEVTRNQG